MMVKIGGNPSVVGCLVVTFPVLLTGVMADRLDSDLIGIIAAGVCVGVLVIIIIALIAFCAFRRMRGSDTDSVLTRKDSQLGSFTTNGRITPHYRPSIVPARGVPVYSVPTQPIMYTMPSSSHYYIGHYTPKFIDAERLEYVRPHYASHRYHTDEEEEEEDRRHVTRTEHVAREAREEPEEEVQRETTVEEEPADATSQPNGHVVHEFAASSVNYRVIRKQHRHEKMPEWLRKSYDENEKSLVLEEESSRASSQCSPEELALRAPPTPDDEIIRAHVAPHSAFFDSQDILRVPPEFTIVDYVDPENQPTESFPRIISQDQDLATADVITDRTNDVINDVTASESRRTTTTTTTVVTTTTLYKVEGGEGVETGEGERETAVVPPASTSTPRAPRFPPSPPPSPSLPPPPEVEVWEGESGGLSHYRMRRRGDGSLSEMPQAVASEED